MVFVTYPAAAAAVSCTVTDRLVVDIPVDFGRFLEPQLDTVSRFRNRPKINNAIARLVACPAAQLLCRSVGRSLGQSVSQSVSQSVRRVADCCFLIDTALGYGASTGVPLTFLRDHWRR